MNRKAPEERLQSVLSHFHKNPRHLTKFQLEEEIEVLRAIVWKMVIYKKLVENYRNQSDKAMKAYAKEQKKKMGDEIFTILKNVPPKVDLEAEAPQ